MIWEPLQGKIDDRFRGSERRVQKTRRNDVIRMITGSGDGDDERGGDVGSAVESSHREMMIAGGRKDGSVDGGRIHVRRRQLQQEKR